MKLEISTTVGGAYESPRTYKDNVPVADEAAAHTTLEAEARGNPAARTDPATGRPVRRFELTGTLTDERGLTAGYVVLRVNPPRRPAYWHEFPNPDIREINIKF